MKALWIRVEAHEVDSVRIARLAETLEIEVPHALGLYVALGGQIAEHAPDGSIADVQDATLERWARWSGKRGRFAAAVRDQLIDEAGQFVDWQDSMGKLVEKRERDRQRKGGSVSVEIPRKIHGSSAESRRVSGATERNGTERSVLRDSSSTSKTSPTAESQGETRENPSPVPPPPASLSLVQLREQLPPGCQDFFAHFYGTASLRRQRDVLTQLAVLASGNAIDYRGGSVRAYSRDRLEMKCRQVIDDRLREPDKAIAILFTKLGDTSDVSEANALPGQRDAKARAPSGPIDPAVEQLISGVASARSIPAKALPPLHGTSR